ncbi:NADP-dependent oxidoreductase [Streptomyces tsukubensis]|uniref:NADPH:quinone reductase n=1 Tax=Streptomyces tsukubensis TaxID=83656 RepID=A0A1V4A7D8_9ACTN|nr:NADP-dependent oxidoreductase [Streptomyces tsukubensis]OON77991.1 NADPH:quinone reductase [Streptomyces tsukubensis]QFR97156.1 zinc-binding dehydrogenase [Streptomyces tsukubensis]
MSDRTMRAITVHGFGGPEVLEVERVPRPEPLPTEVLVRVRAAGINPVDLKTRAGGGMAAVLGDPPFIPGWDVSGVVEEAGRGVTVLQPGDEVFGMPWFPRAAGAYAEYVTAPARQFARKPAVLSHEEAAATPLAALTAWQALVDTAHLGAGQKVLIHAAGGGVGHLAVQFARHLGAHVTVTASEGKHTWLRELGADELIDYRATRFEDVASAMDVVLDLVGDAEDTCTRSLGVLRPGGLLVVVPSSADPAVHGKATAAGLRSTGFLVEPDGTSLARVAGLIDSGEVRVQVDAVYPLEEASTAHARAEEGGARGKTVLAVAPH